MSFPLPRSLATRILIVVLVGSVAAGHPLPSAAAEPSTRSGRVSGLILDRNNQAMAGATVVLTDPSGTEAGSANTDPHGRWSISADQGSYDLTVTAQENGHTLSAKVHRYTVDADTKLNVILAGDPAVRVRAAAAAGSTTGADEPASSASTRSAAATAQSSSTGTATFSGQVLDPDGEPARTNVSIELTAGVSAYEIASPSDDGTFSLDVPAGTYRLRVETDVWNPDDCYGCGPDRFSRQSHSFVVSNFDLSANRQETIRLPRPALLPVTVVDPSNHPVPWAWVTSTSNWTEPMPVSLHLFPGAAVTDVWSDIDITTGADGTATVEYFPGSGPATIWVQPPAGTYLPSEIAVPLNPRGMTVTVQDGPTLHGRLFRDDSPPIATGADGYISGPNGTYPVAITPDGYAVTAPPGRYTMYLEVAHDEEGESSDYWLWDLHTSEFEIVADQRLDLDVPLGKARLWVVDDQGERLDDFYTFGFETTGTTTIGGGIQATSRTDSESWPDDEEYLTVIGPSLTQHLGELDAYAGAPSSAYVAPGEHTIIAFTAGTGPGYPSPSTTTTTTTRPTTTTTTTPVTAADPPARPATQPASTTGSGYWTLSSDGTVHNFGAASQLGNSAAGTAGDLEPTPTGKGYWTLNRNGRIEAFGDAQHSGDVDSGALAGGEIAASLSSTPSGEGYWVFTNRGRAIAFGDAPFLGDVSNVKLNGPVLGSVATPSGTGYYMVASDGGIFAFGDAEFAGSMGGTKLNKPVQSLVPDADGKGYWLVASDGGIFAFDAPFRGSLGAVKLNKPVVGMVRYGDGYLMVGADGGIFNFSTLPFSGSLGDKPPTSPVVAVAALP